MAVFALKMEAVSTSEASGIFYYITGRNKAEDGHLGILNQLRLQGAVDFMKLEHAKVKDGGDQ
jgi:hypothetical protein